MRVQTFKHEELEKALVQWIDPKTDWCNDGDVVTCASGTAALHLALESLQLPKGSEVIVPDFGMIACPRAVALAGLKPVFVDCDDNLLMDLRGVRKAVTGDTSAILAVHIYGRMVNMDSIHNIAEEFGLDVIEDMAELHGVTPHQDTDAACWSFYRNKILAGEEGGAVAFSRRSLDGCKDKNRSDRARSLRSLGFTEKHDFNHIPYGHNYRMSSSHANLILKSLKNFSRTLYDRRRIERELAFQLPKSWQMSGERISPWVFDMRFPGIDTTKQDRLVGSLLDEGIPARHAFKPMTKQTEFAGSPYYSMGEIPKSHTMSRQVIYVPCDPMAIDREAISTIHKVLNRWL